LLRYLSVAHTGRRRIAVEDVEIGRQLIRAGEGVIVANNVADRDETMFRTPTSWTSIVPMRERPWPLATASTSASGSC